MKKIFTMLFIVCSVTLCKAQQFGPPAIEWSKCYGGSLDDYAESINSTIDGGYIVAGGTLSQDVDMIGGYPDDAFILKLDSAGNKEWLKKFGGWGGDNAVNVFATTDGGYIVGGSTNSYNLDTINTGCHGSVDYWVVRFDSIGNVLWNRCYGGTSEDYFVKMVPTSDNHYYLVGNSTSNDGEISNPIANYFCWIVKIDSAGNIIWEKSYGTGYDTWCNNARATNDNGLLFFCNADNMWTNGWSGGGITNALYYNDTTNVGGNWLIKLDTSGNIGWSSLPEHLQQPEYSGPSPLQLIVLKNGNIFCSGQAGPTCNNTWYGLVDTSGLVIDSFVHYCFTLPEWSTAGIETADSMIIILYPTYRIIDKMDLHGNLIWRSSNLDTSLYYDIIQNEDESLVACGSLNNSQCNNGGMDLFIVKFKNDSATCLPYHLTFNISICLGDTFSFQGMNISNSGIYHDTLNSISGCDSIINLNLNVHTIDTLIAQIEDTLVANSSGIIQWFDCKSHQIISGATQNVFVPTVTGNYAAIITEGNCTDTSACINMIVNSINSVTDNGLQFSLFPNPTNETVTVHFSQQANCKLEITNTLGQIVFAKAINHKSETINLQLLPSGLYFCSVRTEYGKTAQQKLVVQH